MSLTFAVFAIFNGAMWTNVVASEAIGAVVAPNRSFVGDANVVERTDSFAFSTSRTFLGGVKQTYTCKIAVE